MATQTIERPAQERPAGTPPAIDDGSHTPPHGDPLLPDLTPAEEPASEPPEPVPVSAPPRR